MTAEAGFTDEEWVRVRRAPMVAGMAISLADPGGPIELSKETMASLRGVGAPPSQDELLLVVSQQVMAMGQQRENPMKGFEVADKSQAGAAVLQELRETQDIVEANATPEEAQAFARWMVEVAQDAADAAKEGGFMGFGAEQVSEGEQRMLDQLRTTLGVTA
jgi:transcription antitermination factor NusG